MTNPKVPSLAVRFIATAGGAGFFPRAPGTLGSLVGVALVAAMHASEVSREVEVLGWLLVAGVGAWAAGKWGSVLGRADDGRIVIDEVSGQWIAAWTVGGALTLENAKLYAASFVLFRVFDIWKPWPIRALDRRSEKLRGVWLQGLGVMADDWLAGFMALGVLQAVRAWGF